MEEVEEKNEDEYYHVWTTSDGIKLYSKEKVDLCCCDDSLHRMGLGCL